MHQEVEIRVEDDDNDLIREFNEKEFSESIIFKNEKSENQSLDSIHKENVHNDTDSIKDEVMRYLDKFDEEPKISLFKNQKRKEIPIEDRFSQLIHKNYQSRSSIKGNLCSKIVKILEEPKSS